MYVLQPAAAFDFTGSHSSHNQAFLEKINTLLCFIPRVLIFGPLPIATHLAESTTSHSGAGPGLLVSSVVASRSADTKLT